MVLSPFLLKLECWMPVIYCFLLLGFCDVAGGNALTALANGLLHGNDARRHSQAFNSLVASCPDVAIEFLPRSIFPSFHSYLYFEFGVFRVSSTAVLHFSFWVCIFVWRFAYTMLVLFQKISTVFTKLFNFYGVVMAFAGLQADAPSCTGNFGLGLPA